MWKSKDFSGKLTKNGSNSMRAVVLDTKFFPKQWMEERRTSGADQFDEMWNGVLHMSPVPNRDHQNLEYEFHKYLDAFWATPKGGRVHQQVNLTTLEDESNWTSNYRIPDLVLLTPDRFEIDRGEYMAGPPTVAIEIHSPQDETYEKLPFYLELGVPEVWIIHRDTKQPEIYLLREAQYVKLPAGRDAWLQSPAIGLEMKVERRGKLTLRMKGKPRSIKNIPR
jgi:Uma2 family endonuclease